MKKVKTPDELRRGEKTLLKKSKETPRQSEEKFRALFDCAKDAIYVLDQKGRLLEVNQAGCEALGYSREELVKMNPLDLDMSGPANLERMETLQRQGHILFETLNRRRDGTLTPVEVSLQVIEWAGKQRILAVCRDITRRNRIEEALRENEQRFRSILERTTDWVWEMDLNGVHTFSNPAMTAILDYRLEEFTGLTVVSLLHEEDRAEVEAKLPQLMAEKRGWRGWVLRWRHKDGSFRFLESNADPILDATGRLQGYRGVDRDITKRKLAEAALVESEKRFSVFMAHLPAGAFLKDHEGRLLFTNRYLKELFDWQDCIGKTTEELAPPEIAERMVADDRKALTEGPMVLQERITDIHGAERFFETYKFPIEVEGSPTLLGGITVDITERKRVEEALEKRIVALTRPLTNVKSIAFEDLFNLHDLQRLQDLFADAWGVAALITSPEGAPITQPSNFTYFCSEFVRRTEKGFRNCQMSDTALGRHNPSGPIIQKCLSAGLWGAGASITVEGRHIANWLIGQVRNEAQNEKHMMKYAREIGADETAFREAFLKVPTMAQEKFEQIAQALFALANQLSTGAYQNIQQARFITERKQAEEALRESERKLNEAQKIAQLGHWTWNVKTGDVEWSEEVFKIFRLDPKSFTPRIDSILALSPWPEDHERDQELIRKAMESHEKGSYEQRFIRPDKSIGYYSSSFQGKYDNNGNLVSIVGTVQDITERKKIEEELRRSEEKLKEAQRIARLVSWELDLTKKTLKWSDGICELLEINPMEFGVSEFGASYEAFLNTIHPDDREIVGHVYNESLKNRTPFKISHRILMKDGRIKWVNEIGRNEYDQQGNPIKSCGIVQDITELKQAEEMMRHMASHDGLTDLPTLKLAKDRLVMAMGMARRSKKTVALMFVDLDGFKAVNDTYGHDVGDEVLREVAKRFCSCVRAIDTVARIGGDEFLIVITELQSWKSAAGIAEKVIQSVSQPIMVNGLRTSVGASIGIAMFPSDSDDADRLIRLADKAMYRIKKSGKNSYAFATAAK